MTYTYDKQLVVDPWCIEIDSKAGYGFAERSIDGTQIGLWFDGLELMDYDGVACLPSKVIAGIAALGFLVNEEEFA